MKKSTQSVRSARSTQSAVCSLHGPRFKVTVNIGGGLSLFIYIQCTIFIQGIYLSRS